MLCTLTTRPPTRMPEYWGDFGIAETLLAVAAAAASTATAVSSADQARKAKNAQMDAQKIAAAQQGQQITTAADMQRQQREREAETIRSRLRVAAGDSGVGFGGTFEALNQQANTDLSLNEQTIGMNASAQIQRVNSAEQMNLIELQSRARNTLLEGAMGGIGGAQAGLSIAGGLSRLGGGTTGTPTTTSLAEPNYSSGFGVS